MARSRRVGFHGAAAVAEGSPTEGAGNAGCGVLARSRCVGFHGAGAAAEGSSTEGAGNARCAEGLARGRREAAALAEGSSTEGGGKARCLARGGSGQNPPTGVSWYISCGWVTEGRQDEGGRRGIGHGRGAGTKDVSRAKGGAEAAGVCGARFQNGPQPPPLEDEGFAEAAGEEAKGRG